MRRRGRDPRTEAYGAWSRLMPSRSATSTAPSAARRRSSRTGRASSPPTPAGSGETVDGETVEQQLPALCPTLMREQSSQRKTLASEYARRHGFALEAVVARIEARRLNGVFEDGRWYVVEQTAVREVKQNPRPKPSTQVPGLWVGADVLVAVSTLCGSVAAWRRWGTDRDVEPLLLLLLMTAVGACLAIYERQANASDWARLREQKERRRRPRRLYRPAGEVSELGFASLQNHVRRTMLLMIATRLVNPFAAAILVCG